MTTDTIENLNRQIFELEYKNGALQAENRKLTKKLMSNKTTVRRMLELAKRLEV